MLHSNNMLFKQKNSQNAIILRALIVWVYLCPCITWGQSGGGWEITYAEAKAAYEDHAVSEAVQLGKVALDQAKDEFGYESINYAKTLRLLTLASFSGKNLEAGIDYNWDELVILEISENQETEDYATALSNLASLYYSLDSMAIAQKYYESALVLFENRASFSKGQALATYNLANIYIKKDKLRQADSLYQKLIEGYQHGWVTDWYYAGALYNKAGLKGIYQSASQQMLQEAAQVFREVQATYRPEYANTLYQLAMNNLQQQQYDLADSLLNELIGWYESKGDTLNPYYSSVLNNAGMIDQAAGNIESAKDLLEKAYHNRQIIYPGNSPEYLTSVNNLAKIYLHAGQSTKAEMLYTDLFNSDTLNMPWQVAMAWENWAMIDAENGKLQEANEKLKSAKLVYEQYLGKENKVSSSIAPRYAVSLYNLGYNYQSIGQYDSAQVFFTKALEVNEKTSGKRDAARVSLLIGLAGLYQDMGKFSDARGYYEDALALQAELGGENTNVYASMLSNYALLFQEMGEYQQAETLFRRSLLIKRSVLGNEHPEYMAALSNLGLLYVETGEYQRATPLLEKSLAFYRGNAQDLRAETANSLINLAKLKQATGKYTEAEPMLKEALSIRKELYGTAHSAYADVISELALFYQTMGNYAAAEPLMTEARKIYKDRYGPLHPDYASLTQNLATLYQINDKNEQAEALLVETLKIDKKVLGENHPDYAVVLGNLASYYEGLGKFQQAEPLFTEALEVNEKTFGVQHPAYASTLHNLAVLYTAMNRLDTAAVLFQNVIDIRENILGENHPDYAQSLYGMAVLYQKKGDYEQAYPFFREVIDKYTQQVKDYFPALSEVEKSAFYRRIEPVIEAYKAFSIEFMQTMDGAEGDLVLRDSVMAGLYDTQLITKALLLDASSKVRKQILNSGDEDLIRLFENWTMKKEYLVKLYAKSPEELQKEQIDIQELEQRANEIEKALSARSTLFSQSMDQQQPSWESVQQALGEGEAAIEIVRIRQNSAGDSVIYAALVITPQDSIPMLAVLPNGNSMENKYYNNFRNSVRFRLQDDLSFAHYWEPIHTLLPSSTHTIYLSPDGIYNKINLHVLKNPETGAYVLDTYAIRLLSSTRDLLDEGSKAMPSFEPAYMRAYLFGYPAYNLDYETTASRADTVGVEGVMENALFTEQIERLPGTKTEVNNLYKLLQERETWSAKKYLGKAAKEEKVKNIRNPKLLHIATHGFFLSDLEVDAETEQKAYGIHLDNIKTNPLLRSGLLLAGASNTISGYVEATSDETVSDIISALESGDGILTAYEVMNMDLAGTDLVVLSACETGLGEIKNGEGVYGLQRAFLIAGAQSIVMSLWRVDDTATQKLMQYFYERWTGGSDKYTAFIQALRSFKEEYPEPYYWGGFVMAGR